jgi:hypothetical protein
MLEPDLPLGTLTLSHPHTRSTHDDEEVHTEDTDSGVIFDTQVDVLFYAETEVAGRGEVSGESAGARWTWSIQDCG